MISETQKGAIGENLISNWLMSGSDGRLCPFRPVADDGGIDLLVFDRQTRRTLLFQVKSRTRTKAMTAGKRSTRFNIRRQTFEVRPDYFIVGVLLDEALQIPEALWLVPSAVLDQQGIDSKKDPDGNPTRYVMPCNPSPTSKDCWSSFKTHTIQGFVESVFDALEQLDGVG